MITQTYYVIETVKKDEPDATPCYVCGEAEEGQEPPVLVYETLTDLVTDLIESPIPEEELSQFIITPRKLTLTFSEDNFSIVQELVEEIPQEELNQIDVTKLIQPTPE